MKVFALKMPPPESASVLVDNIGEVHYRLIISE